MSLSAGEPGSGGACWRDATEQKAVGFGAPPRTPGLPTNTPSICPELTDSPVRKCLANWQPQEEGSGARAGEARPRGGLSSFESLVRLCKNHWRLGGVGIVSTISPGTPLPDPGVLLLSMASTCVSLLAGRPQGTRDLHQCPPRGGITAPAPRSRPTHL